MTFNSEKLILDSEQNQVVNIEAINSLTKLLATEDLNIVHSGSVSTAMFNTKTRTLIIPAWKGIPKLVYLLFTGHEIGHALFTPVEGFNHPLIISKKYNTEGFRSILNVTEDARIEKRVKRKYPGLRSDFTEGYKRLLGAGFFGRTLEEIADSNLVDRLNVRFKGGTNVAETITFDDDEKVFLDRGFALETFEDAIFLAIDIYDKMKEDGPGEEDGEAEEGDDTNAGQGEGQGEGKNAGGEGGEGEPSESGEDSGEDSGESDESSSAESSSADSSESKEAGSGGSISSPKNDSDSGDDDGDDEDSEFDPKSLTDEAIRSNSEGLVDNTVGETVRATLPHGRIVSSNYVHDTKRILEEFEESNLGMNVEASFYSNLRIESLKYFNKCKPVVAYLAKEFEMRKAAEQHRHATTGRTGVINVNALHSYKYNEDVFLRKTITPDAKNHGMVMFIDLSGSMASSIGGAFEQVINLVLFCKKVSIPFEVYGFADSNKGDTASAASAKPNRYKGGDVCVNENFYLRKYISSDLRSSDYKKALEYLFFMKKYWSSDEGYYGSGMLLNETPYRVRLPSSDHLASTPLNDAIIVGMELVEDFRKKSGVEICNVVFLTDGESNSLHDVYDAETQGKHYIGKGASENNAALVFYDEKSRKVLRLNERGYRNSSQAATSYLLDAMRNRCGVRISGFFILPNSPTNAKRAIAQLLGFGYYDTDSKEMQELMPKLRKDGVVVTGVSGYDVHFAIRGGKKLNTSEDGILDSVEDGAKVSTIRSAFKKGSKTKVKSRVLLNKFIEVIA